MAGTPQKKTSSSKKPIQAGTRLISKKEFIGCSQDTMEALTLIDDAGLTNVVYNTTPIYSDLVAEFYLQARSVNNNHFTTTIQGVTVDITPEVVASRLNLRCGEVYPIPPVTQQVAEAEALGYSTKQAGDVKKQVLEKKGFPIKMRWLAEITKRVLLCQEHAKNEVSKEALSMMRAIALGTSVNWGQKFFDLIKRYVDKLDAPSSTYFYMGRIISIIISASRSAEALKGEKTTPVTDLITGNMEAVWVQAGASTARGNTSSAKKPKVVKEVKAEKEQGPKDVSPAKSTRSKTSSAQPKPHEVVVIPDNKFKIKSKPLFKEAGHGIPRKRILSHNQRKTLMKKAAKSSTEPSR